MEFEVGDKVRVIEAANGEEDFSIAEYIGEVGVVASAVDPDFGTIEVEFDDRPRYPFFVDELERAE